MSQTSDDRSETEMRSEYDFSGGIRGTYYEAYQARSRKLKPREKLMLFQQVVLCQDCPAQKLKSGDKATLLDFISYVDSREEGYILEVSGEDGEVRRVAVPVSTVALMRSQYDLRHLEVWKKVDQETTDRPFPVAEDDRLLNAEV